MRNEIFDFTKDCIDHPAPPPQPHARNSISWCPLRLITEWAVQHRFALWERSHPIGEKFGIQISERLLSVMKQVQQI